MKTYIVVVETTDRDRTYGHLEKLLTKHLEVKGQPCHVLENLWCVRSDKEVEDVYNTLDKIVHHPDKFFVVPIDQPWQVRNAKSKDDCFDLNE